MENEPKYKITDEAYEKARKEFLNMSDEKKALIHRECQETFIRLVSMMNETRIKAEKDNDEGKEENESK